MFVVGGGTPRDSREPPETLEHKEVHMDTGELITYISLILGLLGGVAYYLSVGGESTPTERRKKAIGLWVNMIAQVPWVLFNILTGAYGLFVINAITIVGSIRGLLHLHKLLESNKTADDDEDKEE
ncbi:DUF3169 family protein [Virgibacillus salexigens]|uniref:DUF3169 family protein n=1 Tax=Virgibacillus massiliensis TaxID=1462526 RepID=UPI00136D1D86|nr:DUF3169 family protein [Virgibacillus massiliensis]MYL43955.1 hypothetical protein [Virgibacillus massiliensis]